MSEPNPLDPGLDWRRNRDQYGERAFVDKKGEFLSIRDQLIKISRKIAQAIRIRAKIVRNRNEGIAEYAKAHAELAKLTKQRAAAAEAGKPQQHDEMLYTKARSELQAAFRKLERCAKHERIYLEITDYGWQNALYVLNNLKKKLKEAKFPRERIRDIGYLRGLVKFAHKKTAAMEKRVDREAHFLATEDEEHFNAFVEEWRAETKSDKKLAHGINPAKLEAITNDWEAFKASIKAAAPSAAGFGLNSLLLFTGSVPVALGVTALVATAVASVVSALRECENHEDELYPQQARAMVRLQHAA